MSIDFVPGQPLILSGRQPRRRHIPTHFFVGTLLLYAVVLGTFLLYQSPLSRAIPNWRTVVPVLAGVSFYVAASLFLLILGRGQVSRWVVLRATAATLVLTLVLCLILRSQLLYERVDPEATSLRNLIAAVGAVVQAMLSREGLLAQSVQFAGMIALEEAVKLGPVFVLIWRGRINTAHAAMLCGAFCGLTFGTVEAISYGYLFYPVDPAGGSAITTYLTRFFVMSPLHGIWDSLAGGLVFFLCKRRRRDSSTRALMLGALLASYVCAVVIHLAHNTLQLRIGPVMQIVSAFALLAPLYTTAKIARRRAAAEGSPDRGQLVGDLHIFTISLATLFLAASVTFSWAMGSRVKTAGNHAAVVATPIPPAL